MERMKGDKGRHIRGVLGGRLAVGLFALALLGVGTWVGAKLAQAQQTPTLLFQFNGAAAFDQLKEKRRNT